MGEQEPKKAKKHICVGLLAHVDAGKTTLAEGLLYTGGRIRKLGRVDHGDAFLDNFALERERGITIFSKQAQISWEGLDITLLDTPGHVDFSAEMERTLQVLDYALLVISGSDGVQGHVQTLWHLLEQYGIPAFLFVNKMDQPGTDKEKILRELQTKLDSGCQEFGPEPESKGPEFLETLAMCDEALMEEYLETDCLEDSSIAQAVAERHVFPCFFGAALHLEGVEELLKGIRRFALCPVYPDAFGARVFKISRDASGNRLTHLKVTGGTLRVKMPVSNACSAASEGEVWEEKADQLRVYAGAQYSAVDEVEAGGICAVMGLGRTFAGQGLGMESYNAFPVLVPVLTYGLLLPEGSDAVKVLGQLRKLEEEEPQLHVVWQKAGAMGSGGAAGAETAAAAASDTREESRKKSFGVSGGSGVVTTSSARAVSGKKGSGGGILASQSGGRAVPEIHVQVMGEVQIEILKRLISERFGLEVEFTDGQIVYKETIANAVVGIGHFEPLRHYAEVHLLLEPGEPGSGLQFASACSEDILDRNWQRLVLTHLEERSHLGVLTGSAITDMKITLLTGRAHLKHTEGGDFRQATYRALRQGLMQAESVLLEPVFSFTLEVPTGQLGRAMTDIQRMQGRFDAPLTEGDFTAITGSAPAATMRGYQKEVNAYTRGMGRLSCILKGYEPCHNTEEVMEMCGYDPEADLENPASSVFCAHGAGFVVPWDQVPDYAHMESGWNPEVAGDGQSGWGAGSNLNGRGADSRQEQGASGGRQESAGGPESQEPLTGGRFPNAAQTQETGGSRSTGIRAGSLPSRQKKAPGEESHASDYITQEEIEEIFLRTYGKAKRDYEPYRYHQRNMGSTAAAQETGTQSGASGVPGSSSPAVNRKTSADQKENYLLVDGYNIIFAWEDLQALAEVNIDSARDKLMDICSNYQGYEGCTLILVFDAYKVKGNTGSVQKYHNIYVVYTKEAETADQYIEKTVHEIGRKHHVTVATSDRLEQMIIWGEGAVRLSARGFREAVEGASAHILEQYNRQNGADKNRPFEELIKKNL